MTLNEKIAEIVPDTKTPYQLHDVLRAIDEFGEGVYLTVGTTGYLMVNDAEKVQWNLAKNLEDQSPEVIAFLSSLLLGK